MTVSTTAVSWPHGHDEYAVKHVELKNEKAFDRRQNRSDTKESCFLRVVCYRAGSILQIYVHDRNNVMS